MELNDHKGHYPSQVLAALREAVDAHPNERVMQVVVNALGSTDPFYIEDEAAIKRLRAYVLQ